MPSTATTMGASSAPAAASATAAVAAAGGKILDLIVVGGGLSGLTVAHEYHRSTTSTTTPTTSSSSSSSSSSKSWRLLEARSVLGGRLVNDDKGHAIDLGGAWIWPSHQPHLRKLLPELLPDDNALFEQPDDPSSIRIDGGAVRITHALAHELPADQILLKTPATKCSLVNSASLTDSDDNDDNDENGRDTSKELVIRVETNTNAARESNEDDDTPPPVYYLARQVVIAVPPRLVSMHIQFDPPLSPSKQRAMEESHTWMAGVTKVSLVYETRFWDRGTMSNMGLPRYLGPAFQVYDASTRDGTVSALTFFTLVTDQENANNDDDNDDQVLAHQVARQIAAVWKSLGHDSSNDDDDDMTTKALQYTDVHVQRWPLERYISEDARPSTIQPHPHPVGALSQNEWNGMLLFAGSESDQRSPGVMEGAVGAAKRVLKEILPR